MNYPFQNYNCQFYKLRLPIFKLRLPVRINPARELKKYNQSINYERDCLQSAIKRTIFVSSSYFLVVRFFKGEKIFERFIMKSIQLHSPSWNFLFTEQSINSFFLFFFFLFTVFISLPFHWASLSAVSSGKSANHLWTHAKKITSVWLPLLAHYRVKFLI